VYRFQEEFENEQNTHLGVDLRLLTTSGAYELLDSVYLQ
jgi:hypothetical protein